jgi:hypothetical protein
MRIFRQVERHGISKTQVQELADGEEMPAGWSSSKPGEEVATPQKDVQEPVKKAPRRKKASK